MDNGTSHLKTSLIFDLKKPTVKIRHRCNGEVKYARKLLTYSKATCSGNMVSKASETNEALIIAEV